MMWIRISDCAPPKDATFATAMPSGNAWVYDYADWDEGLGEYCNWGCGFHLVTHWAAVTAPQTTNTTGD